MGESGAGRGLDLLLRNMGLAVGDVVAHRVVEQHRFLRDDADLRAQRGEGDVAHIVAVDQDASGGHVEEARDQMNQRALAGAAGTDDGENFAALHFEIDVAQNFARVVAIGLVGKAHTFEPNAP